MYTKVDLLAAAAGPLGWEKLARLCLTFLSDEAVNSLAITHKLVEEKKDFRAVDLMLQLAELIGEKGNLGVKVELKDSDYGYEPDLEDVELRVSDNNIVIEGGYVWRSGCDCD